MSRESDIQALKKLKNDMTQARAYADQAKEEWDKCKAIQHEIETTKFEFTPLPTNNVETTTAKFKEGWKEFFSNTAKFKAVFLGLYSLGMVIFAVMLFIGAYKNNGYLFAAPHQWDETVELILTGAQAAAFPIAAAIFPWVHVVSSDERGSFLKKSLIALGVTAVLFGVLCSWTNSIHLLLYIAGAVIGANLLCFVLQLVFFIISKLPPVFTVKQRAILEAETLKDRENVERNKVNEVKEREEWEAWWAKHKPELKEKSLDHLARGDVAMEKAQAHLADANASTILGEDEKDIAVIDALIQFIESRRADNIKEALHEYDAMMQNKKLLEIEAIKANIEIERAKKENADRQYELEMQRRHQIEMEAQARRSAEMQAQIAANTAAAAASAERMRKDAAAAAAETAETQARVAADVSAIYRNDYYNS